MKTLARYLSDYVCDLRYDDLSFETVKMAKYLLLDYLGVAVGGLDCAAAKVLERQLLDGCLGRCNIIGGTHRTKPIIASLINGTYSHYLDMDDGDKLSISHPGTVVMPAALAMAQAVNCTGKDLIEAIVAGYEINCRIGAAIQPSHQAKRGFHTTGTCGTLGAAVSAGKILNQNSQQVQNTIGLGCLQASGLLEVVNTGGMSKPFQAGKAAASGVLSALMANDGMVSPSEALEGQKGFLNAMADEYNLSLITDNLGYHYRILDVYFKFHAACGLIHSPIDALLDLKKQYRFDINEIKQIEIKVQTYAAEVVGSNNEPKNPHAMKFSLPFSAAIALYYGDALPERYSERTLRDTRIKSLAQLIKVFADSELDFTFPRFRTSVTDVKLKSGQAYQKRLDVAKGDPNNPPTDKDLERKFSLLVKEWLCESHVSEIIREVKNIENLKNINGLVQKVFEGSAAINPIKSSQKK